MVVKTTLYWLRFCNFICKLIISTYEFKLNIFTQKNYPSRTFFQCGIACWIWKSFDHYFLNLSGQESNCWSPEHFFAHLTFSSQFQMENGSTSLSIYRLQGPCNGIFETQCLKHIDYLHFHFKDLEHFKTLNPKIIHN